MSKIVVPEGMLKAVYEKWCHLNPHAVAVPSGEHNALLVEALRWLSNNRQDMSPAILKAIRNDVGFLTVNETNIYEIVNAALHRMFLAPEPDNSEKLDDLLYTDCMITASEHNDQIHEAYRRGKASR
jgi:hypothetical protein